MRLNRVWLIRFLGTMSIVIILALLLQLGSYHQIEKLYEDQPCRYTGEMTDSLEFAIRRLQDLPPVGFCEAVLFKDSRSIVQSAVDRILTEAKQEAEKPQPCVFCLWITTIELDQLEFDYSNYPFLVASKRYMEP
ncbi:MAG: hypothetical protein HWE25_08365 [Alphaproteobacteria bacterium]|nr:hypothetical protein [Alphaproteobacteria bacterium]